MQRGGNRAADDQEGRGVFECTTSINQNIHKYNYFSM